MPRFHFNIYDGISLPDRDGTELGGWPEAQVEAIRLAGSIITVSAKSIQLGEDWLMEVTDEVGLVLFRLDFHVAGAAAVSPHKDQDR